MSTQPTKEEVDYWYNILKETGFEDIEQRDGLLKVWHRTFFINGRNLMCTEAKQTYYRLASFFLNDHKFDNELEKLVWELHSDGLSRRKIIINLKAKGYKIYSSKVQNIIERLTVIMKKVYYEKG